MTSHGDQRKITNCVDGFSLVADEPGLIIEHDPSLSLCVVFILLVFLSLI